MTLPVGLYDRLITEELAEQLRRAFVQPRLRPILMTTLAMIAGMIPVALGSGEGGESAPPCGVL